MIHESNGVRSFRADNPLAAEIKSAVKLAGGSAYLSDVAAVIGGVYQTVERSLPFEADGLVYRVESPGATKAYRKTKKIVARPGRLEDHAPVKRRSSIEARLEARLSELAAFTNVFALREEARRYMESRLSAIEARLAKLEKE